MKMYGPKPIDEMGKIVLPNELLLEVGWGKRSELSLYYVKDIGVLATSRLY